MLLAQCPVAQQAANCIDFQAFRTDLDPDLSYERVSERYLGLIKAWADELKGNGQTSDCGFYLFVDDDAYIHMPAWEALFNRPDIRAQDVWYLGGSVQGGAGAFDCTFCVPSCCAACIAWFL